MALSSCKVPPRKMASNRGDDDDLIKILQEHGTLKKEKIIEAFRKEELTSTQQLVQMRRESPHEKEELYRRLNITTVGERMAMDTIVHEAQRQRIRGLISEVRSRSRGRGASELVIKRQPKKKKVAVGWLHVKEGDKVTQVRQKEGGGSRTVTFSINDDYSTVKDKCTELFFREGESVFGQLETMEVTLASFDRKEVKRVMKDGEPFTIKNYSEETGLSTLRLFLKTQLKKDEVEEESNSSLLDPFNRDDSLDSLIDPFGDNSMDSNIVSFSHSLRTENLDDTIPCQEEQSPITHRCEEVHRSNIVKDCISLFKDETVMQDSLVLRYIDERGVDSGGVSRDVYSAFWIELFEGSAQGCNQRVPCIRNDMAWKDWEAVGRVLAEGFVDHGFFPVHLCKAFVMACPDGPDSVSDDILVKSFLEYVSDDDRDCLKKVLNNMEEMDDEEYDELLDVLSRYRCRTVPNKSTVQKVVTTVAHKELIQKPKYIIDACSQSSHFIRAKGIASEGDLHSLCDKLTPTTKKFIKLVKASPTAQSQTDALEYFKEYIRSVDQTTLEKLVRFCTGSTVLCVDKLDIQFTKSEGFSRTPVALTCGPLLQLPETYESFPELRLEFNGILSSGVLQMDTA